MTPDKLRALYESGLPLRAVAEVAGISHSTVRLRVLSVGGKMRPPGVARFDIERAETMRASGASYAEIGRQMGVSRQRAWAALQRASKTARDSDVSPNRAAT